MPVRSTGSGAGAGAGSASASVGAARDPGGTDVQRARAPQQPVEALAEPLDVVVPAPIGELDRVAGGATAASTPAAPRGAGSSRAVDEHGDDLDAVAGQRAPRSPRRTQS